MSIKVYLAGPEVFLANAREILNAKAELARKAGFLPISPGDLEIPPAPTKKGMGLSISAIDEQMMLEADAIIANLTPFRGVAADVGTAYELGFMCGQGKHAFAYTNVAHDHHQRVLTYYEGAVVADSQGHRRGPDGLSVEDFEMIDNLMLHGGVERRNGTVVVHDAAEDAIYTDLTGFERVLAIAAAKLL
ncbi:nucleoside 2-deoxyribosyltransferase [Paradevosia shaoguanensis]|uniref:Nucleoside 2-deoxyribosyltransferase n=2 Tax=Devosiaceae TaxID=2831106 RepID=A0AA41QRX4_9HYPH|nr:nucleoside 2-deoxyribosyltransferase [Paradevosia shaoguanensis]KFL26640.1 nucleoside 2-deoxyribosyltransferase [Devosia sp. 17-2-E-8]MCF1744043.1 nucleoside 2-deoxyribosyltransferase [Paradevosia shaoguanensis]MCI0128526.1 nucleoside 2-deoxyribosyltransferase [Paradevosia shaoguanensis]